MSGKYRALVVGADKRGIHHAQAFQANGRFEVVGVYDVDQARLNTAAARFGASVKGTDALRVALQAQPDVFCFALFPTSEAE